MDLNHQRASNQNLRVNEVGPPVIATTKASIEKMGSMTLKNRALNRFKSIFVNDFCFETRAMNRTLCVGITELDRFVAQNGWK